MIRETFETETVLSQGQIAWLRCLASLPSTKLIMGATPNTDDIAIAKEAEEILKEQAALRRARGGEDAK